MLPEKGESMIHLTPEQVQALESQAEPLELHNPKTQEVFVLIRKEVFAQVRAWMAPLNRGWDDAAMDVYNEP
jgi:hypothetical protein